MAGPVAVFPACYLSNSALEASFGAAAGSFDAAEVAPIDRWAARGGCVGWTASRGGCPRVLRPINRSPLDVEISLTTRILGC